MYLTEFDEKKYEDVLREDGREEGRSEERKTLLEIVQKLKEGKTPEQLVADGMSFMGSDPINKADKTTRDEIEQLIAENSIKKEFVWN